MFYIRDISIPFSIFWKGDTKSLAAFQYFEKGVQPSQTIFNLGLKFEAAQNYNKIPRVHESKMVTSTPFNLGLKSEAAWNYNEILETELWTNKNKHLSNTTQKRTFQQTLDLINICLPILIDT